MRDIPIFILAFVGICLFTSGMYNLGHRHGESAGIEIAEEAQNNSSECTKLLQRTVGILERANEQSTRLKELTDAARAREKACHQMVEHRKLRGQ